jgi:hypothetical protein
MNAAVLKCLALSVFALVVTSAVSLASTVRDQARPGSYRLAAVQTHETVAVAASPAASAARASTLR